MTHTLDCKIYYSMIGEPFKIYERNTDVNVWATKAIIKMNLLQMELATVGYGSEEPEYETLTDIEFTHDVKGGPYFSSDTQVVIVNGKNQILKLDGKYRFDVKMYRNLDNPKQFCMIMKNKKFTSEPQWISL